MYRQYAASHDLQESKTWPNNSDSSLIMSSTKKRKSCLGKYNVTAKPVRILPLLGMKDLSEDDADDDHDDHDDGDDEPSVEFLQQTPEASSESLTDFSCSGDANQSSVNSWTDTCFTQQHFEPEKPAKESEQSDSSGILPLQKPLEFLSLAPGEKCNQPSAMAHNAQSTPSNLLPKAALFTKITISSKRTTFIARNENFGNNHKTDPPGHNILQRADTNIVTPLFNKINRRVCDSKGAPLSLREGKENDDRRVTVKVAKPELITPSSKNIGANQQSNSIQPTPLTMPESARKMDSRLPHIWSIVSQTPGIKSKKQGEEMHPNSDIQQSARKQQEVVTDKLSKPLKPVIFNPDKHNESPLNAALPSSSGCAHQTCQQNSRITSPDEQYAYCKPTISPKDNEEVRPREKVSPSYQQYEVQKIVQHSRKPVLGINKQDQLQRLSNSHKDLPTPDGIKNLQVQTNWKPNVEPRVVHSEGKKSVFDLVVNKKHYTVLSLLGKGGSSKVYQALNPISSELVAIKCVDFSAVADASMSQGYLNEIELLAKLQGCDTVIRMFDSEYAREKQMLYVVMEKGDTDLSKLINNHTTGGKRNMSVHMIIYYWTEILSAVKSIHDKGIIHSDLKPANFLLVAGRLKLIDFGIASTLQSDMTSIVKETVTGTFNYMSPEAIQVTTQSSSGKAGCKINFRSDVWSLGCILYNLVYGHTPFQGIQNVWAKMKKITDPDHHVPFPPVEGCPSVLQDAMRRCLAFDQKQRPTVDQLLQLPYVSTGLTELPAIKELCSVINRHQRDLPPNVWKAFVEVFPQVTTMKTGE